MKDDLTLEKMLIRQDLNSLIASVDKSNALNEIRLKSMEESNTKLSHIIIGNGKIGLVGKVNNIEERHKEARQDGMIAKTAFFGIIAKCFWDMMFHVK